MPAVQGVGMLARPVAVVFGLVSLLAPALGLLLPPDGDAKVLAVGAAATVLSLAVAWAWRDRDGLRVAGPLLHVLGIALLRHAEGGSPSGLSPLFLVPLFWVALRGSRRDVLVVCSAIAAALVTPILAIGAPAYGVGEWRRALVWITVAPTVGLATADLVARVQRANLQLEELARTDTLTGLLNRRGFAEVATREVIRAARTGEPLVVALLDIDHFKQFNDTYGHPAGDRLLAGASRAWEAELREIDVMARWGGEEFVVLLPRCPEAVAHNVLDRVRIATPEGQHCSIGFALVRRDESIDEAAQRADEALYRAKESGRDRVVAAA